MSPRTGRPKSDNPMKYDIKVRVDEETNTKLLSYAKKHKVTRTEVIRRAIQLLLSKE